MITSRSRYVNGNIVPQQNETVAVRRRFAPVSNRDRFHIWIEGDSLDQLAARYIGSPLMWWKIMDANPIIQNPSDIRPGMEIRIP
jgi:nucleoid-associated protein YgaU